MSRSKGFTVIELVVALAIIAILTAIGLPMALRWKADYRFSSVSRSLSNAVLMARMRGIENRAVFTIIASATITGNPFTGTSASDNKACPGITFTTNVDHGLSPPPSPPAINTLVKPDTGTGIPLPAIWGPVANCPCVKSLNVAAPPPTAGDVVMFSGLNHTVSMNGVEFEVITVPAPNQFTVQHTFSAALGDTAGSDTTGTVRNLIAPGKLRIVPAVHTLGPGPLTDNQENFSGGSAYTLKEEGPGIVFRYDAGTAANPGKLDVNFWAGDPPPLGGSPPPGTLLDPEDAAKNFAEIRFDNRGLPKSTMAFDSVTGAMAVKTVITNYTIRIAERTANDPRQVYYVISPTGKVNTTAN